MIANYGYKDGSGEYYISIDTDKCIDCPVGRACLTGCPKGMFETMTDDYDDEVVWLGAWRGAELVGCCRVILPGGRLPLEVSLYQALPPEVGVAAVDRRRVQVRRIANQRPQQAPAPLLVIA